MNQWKYKVGDRVRYNTISIKEFTCESCGHSETKYTDCQRQGVIASRLRDYILSKEPEMVIKEELQADGSRLMIPFFPPITPPKKGRFYIINKEMIHETAIKEVLHDHKQSMP